MTGKGTFKLTFFNKNLPLLFLPLFDITRTRDTNPGQRGGLDKWRWRC